jgi:hypothetical protein
MRAWIDHAGRLAGRWHVLDVVVGFALAATLLGMVLVQTGCVKTSGQMVQGDADIEYTVLIRNLKTLQPDLFKPGDTLSITIRNQPRGKVKILQATSHPKQVVVPAGIRGYDVVDDPSDPFGYDYVVRLRDHAVVTPDGYVTEGIKVKVGLPIELEGFGYRVNGSLVSVKPAGDGTATPGGHEEITPPPEPMPQ